VVTDANPDGLGDAASDGGPDAGTDLGTDATPDGAGDIGPADVAPPEYDVPAYVPGGEALAVDEVMVLPGLEGVVRVLYDDRGVPHIYGDDVRDLARAQGYITARSRLFQMHTLRLAASGRLAEISGPGAVKGDVLLRMLGLRRVAEEMAARAETDDPALYAVVQAFADGVNARIQEVNEGAVKAPMEVGVFGLKLEPWTVADTMTIVRLQTWDLSFGGQFDEYELLQQALSLKATFDGTALEGIERDVLRFDPPGRTPTITPTAPPAAATFDLDTVLSDPFFAQMSPQLLDRMVQGERWMRTLPHHAMRGGVDFGSNNWAVSGAHTASGAALVANDTHLALRNPAVFYQVQLSNTAAGGDLDVAGVNFAGAPGIVLGRNPHAAWGATVFYADVTDTYVEDVSADGKSVTFEGAQVPIEDSTETFLVLRPGDAQCEDLTTLGWIATMNPQVSAPDDSHCQLTVTVRTVPHHGPIIPWSQGVDAEGKPTAMTWRWTGFEPTTDLSAIWALNTITSVDDFKAALDDFQVGSQNWVYGDADGHIAWYPSLDLPIRKNIAAGDTTHPPFLPMPGDGSAEWTGILDRAELPQAVDPDKGYLATANADPTGISYDADPFNDGPYIGYAWAPGFRQERITMRLEQLLFDGEPITADDMKAIQGDHTSNVAVRVLPHLMAALADAEDGTDPTAAAMLNAAVADAKVYLTEWDLIASSGVGTPADSQAAKGSIATSIFNAFLVRLMHNTFDDEGILGSDGLRIRLLVRMLETPEELVTWDEATGQSRIWDDQGTAETELWSTIMVKSLVEGLAFLSDPAVVGVAAHGGFGTDDMTAWRWGSLHTIKLKHNVAATFDIPKPTTLPDGFPRPGDNYCVDASHPGMGDMNFAFRSGPAIRNVYELTDPPVAYMVIPGGQDEDPSSPHYADEMDKWVANQSPALVTDPAALVAGAERVVDLVPAGQ